MKITSKTALTLLAVALLFCLFPVTGSRLDGSPRPVVTVTESDPVLTHGQKSELIREAILDLAKKHRAPLGRERLRQLAETIYTESLSHEIDPLLVAAIISMESSFQPAAVSEAGAVGLMQLRPFVARDVAERHDLLWSGDITLVEPRQNIRLGVRYYRELVDRFQGDERLALIAYNRGPTRLRSQLRAGGGLVASSYAESVLDLYRRLCEDCGLLQA